MAQIIEVVSEPYIEVPSLGLAIAKERTHLEKDWYETHDALAQEGSKMLTIPEFAGFLNHLRSSPNKKEYQEILEGIIKVRNPWRAEWIDAYFQRREGELCVLTGNRQNEEKITFEPRENRRIGLDSWIANPTKQGLPRECIGGRDLYFWAPGDERVAGLFAYPSVAGLSCNSRPSCGGSHLGVRAAKLIK